jgi:hypothetical protein
MLTLTALREAPLPDGKPGPFSIRRILAVYFALVGPALGALAILKASGSGWVPYLPAAVCILAVLLLLFFTTWADIAAAWAEVKGKLGRDREPRGEQ